MATSPPMSTTPHGAAEAHQDAASHMEGGEAHATLRGYVTGFLISAVMTAIPFWLVMARPIEDSAITAILVIAFAVGQIFVHMIYFLHMDSKSEGGWTIMALIFTAVLVIICISGSLWVMYHLNQNMMPMGDMPMDHGSMSDMQSETEAPVNPIAPFGSAEEK